MNEVFVIGNEAITMDPDARALSFLKSIDPSYETRSNLPPARFIPKFQSAKDNGILEAKAAEAVGMLYACELCGWRCGANRFREKGKCGLMDKAHYRKPFIHIAEEPVINPAAVINFTGCTMKCAYCVREAQKQDEIISENPEAFWKRLAGLLAPYPHTCPIEFGGGDPNPYLPWILSCMKYAPDDIASPLVWNSNLYASEKAISLLDGIADVYLPDFAFGNDACAKRLSGVDGYVDYARKALELMVSQKARVIMRILVLPGHVECCHKKSIDWLAEYKDNLWLSILDQFVPVHIAHKYPEIFRRPRREEIQEVEDYAGGKGLRNVLDAKDFWLS